MKKNNRLLLIVGVLLLFGGIAFAYFVGKMLSEGDGASVKVTTANIKNSELHIEGELALDAPDMLPGHQDVSILKVTAKGNNELIPFNIIWEGTNELGTALNFTVYKTSDSNLKDTVKAECNQKKEKTGGGTMLYETCEITDINKLGEPIGTGTIASNTEQTVTIIAPDQFMTSTTDPGSIMYYYVVLEYPNEGNQTEDMGKGFNGEVKVEPSETEPDIQIASVQVEQSDGTYKESNDIPEGYTIDTKQSKCTNDVTPTWDTTNHGLLVNSLTKSGTTCNLYFYKPSSERTLRNLNLSSQGTITTITGPSCGGSPDGEPGGTCSDGDSKDNNMNQNGIYEVEDDYGTSYVYRGTVNNNWVKFGQESGQDIWWRIIRINGNGTIRLIYTGTSSSGAPATTGTGTQIPTTYNNNNTVQQYNKVYGDNKYVGFMYGGEKEKGTSGSYGDAHKNTNDSTIKHELDEWWKDTDLGEQNNVKNIDIETGFCNDRGLSEGNHGSYLGPGAGFGNKQTAYAPWDRLLEANSTSAATTQKPTLKCGKDDAARKRDLFTGTAAKGVMVDGKTIEGNHVLKNPVGLITSDEVVFAGGYMYQNNNGYWLYTNSNYWTMSPCRFNGSDAYVFCVDSDGYLDSYDVDSTVGVRPVINLSADTVFGAKSEDLANKGTVDNPYVIEGAE